ncbi:hydrophobic protein [Streptomyces sp. NPDC091292]|uniref:hydrophobic protein n=1 Tax=Streptomyces sp. NPDC091292 TaxID=3365991 RepID=UPI003802CBDF
MIAVVLVLLLLLLVFGLGFAVKILWWIALAALVVWVVGILLRGRKTGAGGQRSSWHRW